jgi:hypothetical protein
VPTRPQLKKLKLSLYQDPSPFHEQPVNTFTTTRLNEGYARVARTTLDVVATMMDKTPKYRYTEAIRNGIGFADMNAAHVLIKKYKGNLDKIMQDFMLSGRRTLDSFKVLVCGGRDTTRSQNRSKWDIVNMQLFKSIATWRADPQNRAKIANDMQRLHILTSRYINLIPTTDHIGFMQYSRCCGCGAEPMYVPHEVRTIEGEYPMSVALCKDCNGQEEPSVDWLIVAENFFALTQYLGNIINDITGRTWSGSYKPTSKEHPDTSPIANLQLLA